MEVDCVSGPDLGAGPTLKNTARRALPYAALSGALQILLSLIGVLLLVRYLEPNLYGKWAVMVGFGAPIVLFTSLGFRHSLLRFSSSLEDRDARSRFMWTVLFRRLVPVMAACITIYLAFPLLAARLGLDGQSDVFRLLTPGFFLLAANQYLVVGLNADFRQREVFLGSVLQQTAIVVGVIIGVQLQAGLVYFAGALLVASVLYTLFNVIAAIHHLGRPQWSDLGQAYPEGPEERHYRRSSYVDEVGNSLLSSDMSRFILAAFSTSPQVAVYAVATNVVDRLRALIPLEVFRPLATIVFFKRFDESESVEEVNRIFHLLFAVNRIVTVGYLALFIPLGQAALTWVFRPDYGISYLPVVILLTGIGIFAMPIGLVAQTLRRPQWLVYSKIAVILNIGLGIPLTIEYGPSGMAAATLVSEFTKNVIVYGLLRREFEIRYPLAINLRFVLAGASVVVLLFAIDSHVHVLFAGAIGAIGWLAALRVFRVLSAEQRQLLRSITPDRFQRPLRIVLGA